jgi:hypothetical protein
MIAKYHYISNLRRSAAISLSEIFDVLNSEEIESYDGYLWESNAGNCKITALVVLLVNVIYY